MLKSKPIDDAMPKVELTALQEAMWWICQRVEDKSVYNITWRLACAAPLDLAALQTAWQAVVDRHEALRWSIARGQDGLSAFIQREVEVAVGQRECADSGSAPTDALLQTIAEDSHRIPFALDCAPLARLTMVRVGDSHELIITAHHIVVDGLGMQLLFADLSEAYSMAVRGQQPVFATEASSWREFALEELATRNGGHWQSSIDYWRKTLDGALAATIVGDRDRYSGTGGAGMTLRHTFSEQAANGLAALMKLSSATSFAVVLAALQILLARSGAGSDIVIGTVAANRLSERDQQLVGYLVNMCLIRAKISEQDTIAEVVRRSSEASWEMFAHQAVPYPVVFSSLTESTRSGLGDIAPLMLNYLGSIGSGLRLGDIGLTMRPSPNLAARNDIGIAYWHTETGGLMAEVEYNTIRYDRDTVLQLLSDLDTVLAHGVTPTRIVGDVQVLTKSTTALAEHRVHRVLDMPCVSAAHEAADPEERIVRQAWVDVLGYPPASLDSDFFEEGGHSLKAVELIAAIAEITGAELDFAIWLANPTPRSVLAQLNNLKGAGADRNERCESL